MQEGEDDDLDAGLSGDLATVTDEEWREAHERFVVGAVPDEESAFEWVPEVDKAHYGYQPGEPSAIPLEDDSG